MTPKETKELIENLTEKKSKLETQLAVKQSELKAIQNKMEEASPRVLEIVGSIEPKEITEYLKKLEKEIEDSLAKLNSMEG